MAKNEPAAPATVRARVLTACRIADTDCAADAVVELATADAAELTAQGLVDTAPDAVAYADSLAAPSA